MNQEMDDEPLVYRSLSDTQKKLVAILPIPSAILSLIGSSIIVYMAMKSRRNTTKKWTPYNRLIMGMSCFDILTSVTLTVASFLYPQESSDKVWVIGNDTTCSIVGALNQLIYGVILYYGSLSIYFVLTARFGYSNDQISHGVEPYFHIFCFGYPLVTSFVGLFLGAYSEPEIGMGCWVKRWPKKCIAYREPEGSEETCRSELIGWILGGWVGAGIFALAFLNTILLFAHVRRQEKLIGKAVKKPSSDEVMRSSVFKTELMKYEEEEKSEQLLLSSVRTVPPTSSPLDETAEQMRQLKRLKLVQSQALLYFLSYFFTNGWSQLLRLVESTAQSMVEEKELPYNFYGLLLGQCIFYPLQGFTNLIVFVRPKYLALRAANPNETRLSILKRAIFEEDPMDASPSPTNHVNDTSKHSHSFFEDETRKPSSTEGNDNAPPPMVPPQSEPERVVSTGGISIASVSSMTSGGEEMKEVMERTKLRLEKYKAGRLASGESTGDSSGPDDLLSPIQKVRAKLKMESSGIPDLFGDDDSDDNEPPLPVPETIERSPSLSGRRGTGPSAIRMDGSIVQGESSEFGT